MTRYAFNQDSNSTTLDEALELIPGLTIEKLKNYTIDRLIGYRGINFLFEYKKPDGLKKNGEPKKNDFTDNQIKFFQTWAGSVNIIRDLNDALLVLGISQNEYETYKGKPR